MNSKISLEIFVLIIFSQDFFLTLQVLCVYIVASSLVVYGIPGCTNVYISMAICVSCIFSSALFVCLFAVF